MAVFLSLLSSPRPNLFSQNYVIPTKPAAALSSQPNKMRVSYPLKEGQSRHFHSLPSGLNLEVIVQKKHNKRNGGVGVNEDDRGREKSSPPLVFVHGSYHAAWCFAEHWLPFFSHSGFDCYAISLLGQYLLLLVKGESDAPDNSVAGTLQTHAGDIAHFINKNLKSSPVLIGHSFGGLIIQYYIAKLKNDPILLRTRNLYPELTGAVLVCSVPPSGNGGLVWRYLFTKPIAAFKVTCSLAAKAFQTSLPLCRETFFSATMEDHLVLRYQELMKESSRMPLFDLKKLNATLPVASVPKSSIELLVLGATDDFIVDAEGLKETGDFYGVLPISIEGVAHDIMLDCEWERGAKVIESWLNEIVTT